MGGTDRFFLHPINFRESGPRGRRKPFISDVSRQHIEKIGENNRWIGPWQKNGY